LEAEILVLRQQIIVLRRGKRSLCVLKTSSALIRAFSTFCESRGFPVSRE
jgi:hypothetical protein